MRFARRRVACLLAAVPIISGPLSAQVTRASMESPEVDSCIARLDPQLDIGYDRIAVRCPDLMKKIGQGSWAHWLPRGWNEPGNDLSAGSLKELYRLITRESAAQYLGPAPEVARLPAAMNNLADTGPGGAWSRFKNWLRSILERREEPTGDSWFARLSSKIGVAQSVRQIIAYGSLVVVVILAAAIIGNELRAAGLIRARSGARRRPHGNPAGNAGGPVGDLQNAPLRERPRLLLQIIVSKLSEREILPAPGALTVRELMRSARLPEQADRERLSRLALTAERVRYSGGQIESADIEGPVTGGRELLSRLEAGSL